jgi:hypothetical protein
MNHKDNFEKRKEKILNDKDICIENRKLFKTFFEWEENKLKRIRNLRELDEKCYKTLKDYVTYFYNVNKWFNNKPWKNLTKNEIKRVYDDLEDGKIKKNDGTPFQDRASYYNKIFKSKPFTLANKSDIARDVMEFYKPTDNQEVNYVEFEDFLKLVNVAISPIHRLLLWICWDIGENINAVLQLQKKNFVRQINPDTKEVEYIVNLPKEILKRSRKPRSEITNYKQTTELLDILIKDLNDEDLLFKFGYRQAESIFDRVVKKTNIQCKPKGKRPTWKDLRSGMTCDLLKKGWSSDELNARLGHSPSSTEIDKYINFLAIDKQKPKIKVYQSNLAKLELDIEHFKEREKLKELKIESSKKEIEKLKTGISKAHEGLEKSQNGISQMISFIINFEKNKNNPDKQKEIIEMMKKFEVDNEN